MGSRRQTCSGHVEAVFSEHIKAGAEGRWKVYICSHCTGNSPTAGEVLKKQQHTRDLAFCSQPHRHIFLSPLFLPNPCLVHLFQILLWQMMENPPVGGDHEPSVDWEIGKKEKQLWMIGVTRLSFKAMVACSPGQPLPGRGPQSPQRKWSSGSSKFMQAAGLRHAHLTLQHLPLQLLTFFSRLFLLQG